MTPGNQNNEPHSHTEELDLEKGVNRRGLIEFKHLSVSRLAIPQDDDEEDQQERSEESEDYIRQGQGKAVTLAGESISRSGSTSIECPNRPSHTQKNYHGVIQVIVPNEHRRFYEKVWLPKVFQKLSALQGFRNRFVEVGSSNEDSTEYVVVLIFSTFEHFKAWEVSDVRSECLQELSRKQIEGTVINAYGGSLAGSNNTKSNSISTQSDLLAHTTSNKISLHNGIKQVPRALPPPKWKLALIITCAVYSTLLVNSLSGTVDGMLAADMPLGLVLFISITHTVTFLTYAGLPLLMSIPFVNHWLRLKRRCEPARMHPLHAVLDQGLQVFSIKMKPKEIPQEVLDKIYKLEVRLDKLLGMNKTMQAELDAIRPSPSNQTTPNNTLTTTISITPSTTAASITSTTATVGKDDITEDDKFLEQMVGSLETHQELLQKQYPSQSQVQSQSRPSSPSPSQSNGEMMRDRAAPLTMACRHYVKWEHHLDFENWSKEMDAEMSKFNGYEGMITIAPKNDGDPYINSFTFSTFEDLMIFSQSNGRKQLLCRLLPMLEAASEYQVAEERSFSDAFTELCVPTGGKAQTRPPPLWKTTILTIIPLHIVVWQGGSNIRPYITRQVSLNGFLLLFLLTCFNVFVNSYIALPLALSQFGDWLNMPRPVRARENEEKKFHISWKFLDVGLSFRSKILFVCVYVAINIMLGYI